MTNLMLSSDDISPSTSLETLPRRENPIGRAGGGLRCEVPQVTVPREGIQTDLRAVDRQLFKLRSELHMARELEIPPKFWTDYFIDLLRYSDPDLNILEKWGLIFEDSRRGALQEHLDEMDKILQQMIELRVKDRLEIGEPRCEAIRLWTPDPNYTDSSTTDPYIRLWSPETDSSITDPSTGEISQ